MSPDRFRSLSDLLRAISEMRIGRDIGDPSGLVVLAKGDAELTNYEMKCQAETTPLPSMNQSRSLSLFAMTTPEAKLQVTRLHKAVKHNRWLLAIVFIVSLASAWWGSILQGWASFGFSLGMSVLSFGVGYKAVTNIIRETIYPSA